MIAQLAALPTYEAYKDSGVEWLGEIPAQTVGRNKRSISGKVANARNAYRLILAYELPPQSDEANDD